MSSSRPRPLILLAAASLLLGEAGACKNPPPKDKPETLAKLKDCEDKAAGIGDKDNLIKQYESEIARLKLESGAQEFVFTIEGDALAVKKRPQGSGGPPVDDKMAAALSQNFIDVVNKSRGSIQKCYEQALKKNTGLQARTISLTVSASFQPSGAYSRSSFKPPLGDAFDGCMKGVATRWKLPAASQGMTFQATVSLSPS
jgi:hypothetical protein